MDHYDQFSRQNETSQNMSLRANDTTQNVSININESLPKSINKDDDESLVSSEKWNEITSCAKRSGPEVKKNEMNS